MVSGPWNHIAPSLYPLVSCIPCTPPAPPLYPLPLSGPLLPIHPLSPFLSFPFSRGWAHIRLLLAILPTVPPSPISHFPLLAISLTAPLPIPSLSFMCVANLLLLEKSLLAQDNCIPPHNISTPQEKGTMFFCATDSVANRRYGQGIDQEIYIPPVFYI